MIHAYDLADAAQKLYQWSRPYLIREHPDTGWVVMTDRGEVCQNQGQFRVFVLESPTPEQLAVIPTHVDGFAVKVSVSAKVSSAALWPVTFMGSEISL